MIELSIIIPCYNEDENIFPLFKKIEKLIYETNNVEIIIVDNGSTDKTNENIIKSNLYLEDKIKLKKIDHNIGYGYGIMSGVYAATGNHIGWCHADLQTEPADVYSSYLKNKDLLQKDNCVVKGLRKNRNIYDSVFTFGMSVVASLVFFSKINDINAQPKLFPKSFLKCLNDYPNDFSLDLFFLIMAKKNNYQIINYDVEMKDRLYGEAKGGGTIKGKIKLVIRTFAYIIELRRKLWKL